MNPLTQQPSATEKTHAELSRLSKLALDQMELSWRRAFQLVWSNPLGLTPQQVIDSFGTDAQAVFLESYQTGEYLKAHGRLVGVTNAPAVSYTANPDGSITLVA